MIRDSEIEELDETNTPKALAAAHWYFDPYCSTSVPPRFRYKAKLSAEEFDHRIENKEHIDRRVYILENQWGVKATVYKHPVGVA